MLRSKVQKQGGFYVCASCRRQNLHSLTQPRSRAPTSGRAPAPSVTTLNGVRGYTSYGKFGSGTLPGQANVDWARTAPPPVFGGKKPGIFQGGKITPAKPTSMSGNKPAAAGGGPVSGTPGQPSPAADPPRAATTQGDNIAQDRWRPTEQKPFSPPGRIGSANRIPMRSATGTSAMGNYNPGSSPVAPVTPALRGMKENVPGPPQSVSDAPATAQRPESRDSGFSSQGFPIRRRAAGSEPQRKSPTYPLLRQRPPKVDEFETLSPFNLPGEGQPLSPIPTKSPTEQASTTSPYQGLPPRLPSESGRPGRPSISNTSFRVGKPVADPTETVTSSRTASPGGPEGVPLKEPASGLGSTGSRQASQLPDPVDQFAMMQRAAEASSGDQQRSGGESDWGLPESDMASPEERQALRRRQNAVSQRAPRREARPAGRESEFDRGMQRRDRGRNVERFEDRPRKRPTQRNRGYDEDEDDDNDTGFDYEEYQARKQAANRRKEEKRAAKEAEAPKTILLPEYITVFDLSQALGVRPEQFLRDLGELGFENILHDSIMTGETAALVAAEYGLDPVLDTGDEIDLKPRPPPEDPSTLPPRPPIVTIMGHVDHGKTTMLDWLRKSSVAAQEHGGITQHIGAFSVRLSSGKLITFLDTPGHAAFLSMRQRGANVTDIVVLVVAVDDSVKPQTLEALKHAQNAKVPIIVAINKIDMDERRIDQVKQDLAANGVEIEDFGGDVQVVGVSGKTGKGMDDLEENILTLSEILDVRAETDGMAEGWILETSVKVDGKVATVLVKRGTIRVGDLVVAGTTYARVRMMRNEAGVEVEEAGPGTPVEVLGWRDSPVAGDLVLQAEDEGRAQAAVDYREELADRAKAATQKGEEELKNREKAEQEALEKMMAEDGEDAVSEEAEQSGPKTVNTIVRGDVMGSVEAVCNAVLEIGNNEVHARVLRSSPGQINESDIDLMAVAKGCIINFNNPIPGYIQSMAEEKGVRILDHTIIYHLVEDVKEMMSEQLAPIISQKVLAEAEVLQVFAINIVKRKYKNIAGVKVRTGTLTRGGMYRVMRDGEKIFEGKLDALKQGKKDVKEMRRGTECGVSFESWDHFEAGDVIQLYEEVQQKRYL
ncbi:hypothetical protein KVR01_012451 [Diaporthe batatas]|uniref:translation initiation factor 2 n=1 Tax=Diaporthe batatas TaxID=748121 RepID=UPI001D04C637|nr:translation initiation factor 2 [Diaporthe batatas]KAG8157789.1 hypothetical protein KVR01_012451 [Diaporthe batatas]